MLHHKIKSQPISTSFNQSRGNSRHLYNILIILVVASDNAPEASERIKKEKKRTKENKHKHCQTRLTVKEKYTKHDTNRNTSRILFFFPPFISNCVRIHIIRILHTHWRLYPPVYRMFRMCLCLVGNSSSLSPGICPLRLVYKFYRATNVLAVNWNIMTVHDKRQLHDDRHWGHDIMSINILYVKENGLSHLSLPTIIYVLLLLAFDEVHLFMHAHVRYITSVITICKNAIMHVEVDVKSN